MNEKNKFALFNNYFIPFSETVEMKTPNDTISL